MIWCNKHKIRYSDGLWRAYKDGVAKYSAPEFTQLVNLLNAQLASNA